MKLHFNILSVILSPLCLGGDELNSHMIISNLDIITELDPCDNHISFSITHLPLDKMAGRHFPENIFKCIFFNVKFVLCIKFQLGLFLSFRLTKSENYFR